MNSMSMDDIFNDLLGVGDSKDEIDVSGLDEVEKLMVDEVVEESLDDATTSMVISDNVEYPFIYIYPYKYECEAERLQEITVEDTSNDEDKINFMAPFNGNIVKVGRFRLDFKNIYKLLQFKKYSMYMIISDEEKMELTIENLLNTLVEE